MLFLGSSYTTGTIAPYIASYYDVEEKTVEFILPAIFVINTVFIPFGGRITAKYHPKLLIAIAATIRISLQVAAAYITSFVPFALCYAFGYGICNGMTYLIPMHHGWLWFPNAPGLISGIIIGGFGFGALIFAPLATSIVNPNGEVPNP